MFTKQKASIVKSGIFLLAFFIITSVEFSYGQANRFYTVNAKFKMEGSGDYKDAYMVLQKNGVAITTLPGQSSYKIDLEYGGDYVFSFSKPGYITKRININTVVNDQERIDQGFESYPFTVILIKQYDDVNIVVFNQPVAKIMYSKKFDEFDYDTDYTKSIQSAIKKAEDELKAKDKEAKANPPKPAVDSTAIIAKAKKAEELKASEEAKKIADAEKKKTDEEKIAKKKEEQKQLAAQKLKEKEDADAKKRADLIAAANERKTAQERAAADAQKTAEEKAAAKEKKLADEKAAADERKAADEKAAEDRRKKASEREALDAKKNATASRGEDAQKNKVTENGGEDANKDLATTSDNDGLKPNVSLSGGSDKKEKITTAINDKDVVPEKKIEKPSQTEVIKSAPEKIDENVTINREEISEDKKTTSHVWITKGDKTVLFSKVKYAWGGVFYFREMKISISENMFKMADAGKVNF